MPVLKMPTVAPRTGLNRRNFLRIMLWAGLGSCSWKSAFAAFDAISPAERFLSLYNPHTKESFNGVFWRNGAYDAGALNNINYLMRDIRADSIKPIDKELLDLIFSISKKLKPQKPFHVICGYRTPKTNALLFKRNKKAAKNSYHMHGQAVDIRLPGFKTSVLRRAAYKLSKGGIGYYPRRRFVHLDVGPVRYWIA